jgi:hypothetical protein
MNYKAYFLKMFVYLYTTNAVMPHPQPRTGQRFPTERPAEPHEPPRANPPDPILSRRENPGLILSIRGRAG